MRFLKLILRLITFSFLTILTQVGGMVYLLNFVSYKFINKRFNNKWIRKFSKLVSFIILYCITTFLIVPSIAKQFGRVSLPLTATHNLRPLTVWTCFLNRNYVRPELRKAAFEVGDEMNIKYPGTIINYLEANFPFLNGFPLFPHLSHNDGKKLDLSFCYNDSQTGQPTNNAPSFIGYGISEEPSAQEYNTAEDCDEKGFWRYSLIMKLMPQGNKGNFVFNAQKTKDLVELFGNKESIGRIFIEPHLKTRLNLSGDKIKFHGCRAVRHDDHFHVQLK